MDTISIILLCVYFYLNGIGTLYLYFEGDRPSGYVEWVSFIFFSFFFIPCFTLISLYFILNDVFQFRSWYIYFFNFSRFEKMFLEKPNIADYVNQSWMNKILIKLIKKKIEKRQKI